MSVMAVRVCLTAPARYIHVNILYVYSYIHQLIIMSILVYFLKQFFYFFLSTDVVIATKLVKNCVTCVINVVVKIFRYIWQKKREEESKRMTDACNNINILKTLTQS